MLLRDGDCLQSCFKLDPSERLSCSQLLEHPYFESLRSSAEYSRQADDEMQKRREREQRKREPDKMLGSRAVSPCSLITCSVDEKMHL